jgi:Protein RETICULATA-related
MSSNDYLSKIDKLSPNNLQTGSFAAADVGFEPASVATGYGGGSVGGSGGGGGGGGGDSSGRGGESGEGSGDEVTLAAMLAKMKMTMADVPADVRRAYEGGLVGAEVVGNFLLARANWLSRFLMGTTPGMRNRFLADRFFLLKIMIEEGMGIAGKLGAEYERRRENFFKEGEFVFANLITALLADFALVYLPAPSVALEKTAAGTSWFKRVATDLPSNIFQTDRAFTLSQRGAGFALKAGQLFAVGFMCSIIGAAMTNGLVYVREKVDKNYKPKTAKTNVFAVSLLYATFLGLSSGSRYQLVNGIENHIFPRVFAKAPVLLEQVSTFLLRYANTFWGSQQWVIFCRMTNVQKLATE